jgi:hypothetical protein
MRSGLAKIITKVSNLKYLDDNNGKISKVLNNVLLASCENRISISQLVHYTQDECCWERLQVERDSHHPAIYNNWVLCCVFGSKDELKCTTARIP